MQAVTLSTPVRPSGRAESTADRSRVDADAAPAAAGPVVAAAPAQDTAAAPHGRGLRHWRPQAQQQMAAAQQAQDYLDLTAGQLQSLKAELSAKLAGLQAQDSQLQAKLQQMASTWRNRHGASGGSLDPQLRFTSPEPATQRFTIRGLDLQALQSGAAETLTISLGGAGVAAVAIEAGLSAEALVQRLDRALAPGGVRAGLDEAGALVFSVAESAWPAVRDNLAIKGDGIRFPTGQLHRAQADAEPAAMDPQSWHTADAAALRRALQQVVQALNQVKQARAAVVRALAAAGNPGAQPVQSPDDAAVARSLAAGFESGTNMPGYAVFSSVAAALIGVSRSRVVSLLGLPPGS